MDVSADPWGFAPAPWLRGFTATLPLTLSATSLFAWSMAAPLLLPERPWCEMGEVPRMSDQRGTRRVNIVSLPAIVGSTGS